MKLLALAGLAALAAGASAGVWNEIPDAIQLVPGQMTSGAGSLDTIYGDFGSGSDVDMYCIHIDMGPVLFSATTTNALTTTNGLDTQLFLFTSAGAAIAFNDDDPTGGGSLFTSNLTPGHPLYASLAPGDYLLAVSQYDVDPHDGTFYLFPDSPFAAVNGPNTGVGLLAGWAGSAFGTPGAYEIDLTGCGYCDSVPEPATFLALGAGLALLASRRRRK